MTDVASDPNFLGTVVATLGGVVGVVATGWFGIVANQQAKKASSKRQAVEESSTAQGDWLALMKGYQSQQKTYDAQMLSLTARLDTTEHKVGRLEREVTNLREQVENFKRLYGLAIGYINTLLHFAKAHKGTDNIPHIPDEIAHDVLI